jgi:hypothetical protein
MDFTIFPDDKAASGWTCFGIGVALFLCTILAAAGLKRLERGWHQGKSKSCLKNSSFAILRRIYFWFQGLVCVFSWRGVWVLWDAYAATINGSAIYSGVAGHVIGTIVLLCMFSFRSVVTQIFYFPSRNHHHLGYFDVWKPFAPY